MTTAKCKRLLILILALSLLALTLTGCKRQLVHNVTGAHIPKSSTTQLSMDQVEKAIIAAGAGRGWVMDSQEPGLIIATLNIRAHQAIVQIKYDQVSFDISYENSTNLKYDGEKIHSSYNRWITYLEQDINSRLATELAQSK